MTEETMCPASNEYWRPNVPSKLTDADLQRLRKTAEAATPGAWERHSWHIWLANSCKRIVLGATNSAGRTEETSNNLNYIAAFDPPTAIALLDRIASLEAALFRC